MGCFLRLKFGHKRDTKKIDAAAAAASNGTGDLDPKEEKDFDGTNGWFQHWGNQDSLPK